MDQKEKERILAQIEALPKGIIAVKTIHGKPYEYWQYRENGKQVTKRVKGETLALLQQQIAERKRLQALLHSGVVMQHPAPADVSSPRPFHCMTRTGTELLSFAEPVGAFHTRYMFSELQRYLREPVSDRVLILYGLRRTGKTTMIRQAILQMEDTMRQRTAFIQISPENTLAHLHEDLRLLESQGFRYVFIDEVTLLDDFIEGAALFSDIFVASGMKIVLSGTDSLGFVFTKEEQLYDRCILLHTTLIPYREFADVLGIADFDRYIRYGGTMSMGGINYNKDRLPFSDQQAVNEYINTSIAQNVQHSLKNYRYGGHFRALRSLYDAGELTGAINRVVEDINHRFAADVLRRTFRSHDLGVSRNNLRKDRQMPTDVLDHIDTEEVTRRLMHLLDIKNQEEQRILPEEIHVREIRSYLALLDLIFEINIEFAEGSIPSAKRTVIAQPGLRFAQSEALITSLLQDHTFRDIPIGERMRISERIVSEIQGRMMEEIILLETMLAFPRLQVCTLQFPVGEFDMVVFDPATISCRLYEIKHSRERAPEQYRHLLDEEKCSIARQLYGTIEEKYVIYRGEEAFEQDIHYLNAESYLCSLGDK